MDHTFLFQEGLWDAKGHIVRGEDTHETASDARIVHWPGVWLVEWAPSPGSRDPEKAERSVEVTPPAEGQDHTSWTAFDSVLGKQHGHFAFVNDTILSSFTCGDGKRFGSETLRRLDDDRYEYLGALFEGSRRIVSWALMLTRRSATG